MQAASVTDSVDSILTDTPESVITKVTVAARLLVADELIEMPSLYVEHEEAHAPTAIP